MRDTILTLIKLQDIDLRIRDIDQKLRTEPKALDEIKKELDQAKQELSLQMEKLKEKEREKRNAELELSDCEARIKKSQQRIMEVKTNKEYQALLIEIDEIKTLVSQWEERILELLEDIDSIKKTIAEGEKRIKELEKRRDLMQIRVNNSLKRLKEELSVLRQDREEVAKKLPEDLVKRYNFICDRRNGKAIVPVNHDAVCEGCHMHIPPQQYNELLKVDRIMSCPTCQRIIYWKGLIEETES